MKVCHWFRSDLRVGDNAALRAAAAHATSLHLVYVLDPRLQKGPTQGEARLSFLRRNLKVLDSELRKQGQLLHILRGDPSEVLRKLQKREQFDRFTWNRDYGPFAKQRDEAVTQSVESLGAKVRTFKDRVFFESHQVRTQQGGPYSIYTPYRRAWQNLIEEHLESAPAEIKLPPPVEKAKTFELEAAAPETPELPEPGEVAARRRLEEFMNQHAATYDEDRNAVALAATSRLAPYLRFGVISPRDCLRCALKAQRDRPHASGIETWIHQLIWRDFYSAVLDLNPHVLKRSHKPEYSTIAWENDAGLFDAWCAGETGFPLVDAGMRELNVTGYMHNRARMVVASFLTKDLLIDWRWGERYFIKKLIDGDPANNNGGWQWAASTGTDAQPYFRIFNPVSQSKRFDPDGEYIRRWIPELDGASIPALHEPWKRPLETSTYASRVVDHAERRLVALDLYKAARAGR